MDAETIAMSSTSPESIAASDTQTSTDSISTESASTDTTNTTSEQVSATQAQIAEFQPNYKFKVIDEEKEFDEFIKGSIKDEDSMKKVKELYEKAYGLDYVKPKYESTKQRLEQIEPQFNAISNDLKLVGQHLKNQDLGSFFKTFKLTDDQILKYALERVEFLEATPDKQQQILDAQRFKSNNAHMSMENEQLKSYKQQHEDAMFKNEFDTALSFPTVSPIAQSFDARAGKPGAFAEAIAKYGASESRQAGRNLAVSEVVQQFIKTFGLTAPQPSQAAAYAQVPVGNGETAERKETLPKVPANGGSPVAAKVKTFEDLKKKQKESFGSGYGGQGF